MAEVEFKGLWKVDIIESERGWGQKINETKYFETEQEAKTFSNSYNAKYNPPLKPGEGVPDWYMVAEDPVLVK